MRVIIGLTFALVAIAFALWRGGSPERLFAAILGAMFVVDRAGHRLIGNSNVAAIDLLHLTIDLTSFAAMMAIMIHARRLWPIWACSFQLLSLATYPLLVLEMQLPRVIQIILAVAPSYLISASLLAGTAFHQARLKRRGSDPSWRSFSRRAIAPMPKPTPPSY